MDFITLKPENARACGAYLTQRSYAALCAGAAAGLCALDGGLPLGALVLGAYMRIACVTRQQRSFYEPAHPCRRSASSCVIAALRPRRSTPRST